MLYLIRLSPPLLIYLTIICLTEVVEAYHEWLVEIAGPKSTAQEFAEHNELIFVDEMQGMPYHYIFHSENPQPFGQGNSRVKREALVSKIMPQKELVRKKRSNFMNWNDPYFNQMWYLHRSFRNPSSYDMNVLEAWGLGYSGKGVVVTIMDDGVDYTHDDLKQNYDKKASYDINGRDDDPMPDIKNSMNHHGTRCAGQVAASGNNTQCIVGVAYEASIGGIRMLDGKITDRVEAEALMYNVEYIDIYSGSWGPDDSGENHEGPGQLASYAFNTAISKGRRGLGAIFIWASGNGGNSGDSCAFDGYASNIYTISISSVSEFNSRPWYQERCTSTMATTYSSGDSGQKQVLSIDLFNKCTSQHTGTSASAPLAAGFVALLLQANPELTWRDVQYIIVLTSITKPFRDGHFTRNAAGREYSMFYGFGLMDAGKMVRLGRLWRSLPKQHKCKSAQISHVKKLEGKFDIQIPFHFNGCEGGNSSESGETGQRVRFVEHLQLFLDLDYSYRGILRIQLISPSGTSAVIMPTRIRDSHNGDAGFRKIPLTTVQFWGEPLSGQWNVRIDNQNACREIEEGYASSHLKTSCENVMATANKQFGGLNNTWLVAYGTDDFPIRLKKPPVQGKFAPPKEWFSKCEKYVVDDEDSSGSTTKFKCDPECDPYGGCDESNNCLGGCRNFVLLDGSCVNKCPNGTSGIMTMSESPSHKKLTKGKLCENCSEICKTCFRPNSEMDCLSCHKDQYLIPLLNNYEISESNRQASSISGYLKVPEFMGTCRSECPPNYYKDLMTFRCLKCVKNCQQCSGPEYTDCVKCNPGFIKGSSECKDQSEFKCSPGTQYQEGVCFGCSDVSTLIPLPPTSEITPEPEQEAIKCAVDFCLPNGKCAWCSPPDNYTLRDIYMYDGKCLIGSCPKGTHVSRRLRNSWSFESASRSSESFRIHRLRDIQEQTRVWLCEPCPPGCVDCSPRMIEEAPVERNELLPLCIKCDMNLQLISGNDLSQQSTCLSNCPLGHYNESVPIAKNSLVNDQCMASCSPECASCNLSSEHCLTCKDLNYSLAPNEKPFLHYNCVKKESCPPGFYVQQDTFSHRCVSCPPGCRTCSGPGRCESCHSDFVLHKNGACLIKTFCGSSQYYDPSRNQCSSCHSSCETCNGPSMNDCKTCHRLGNAGDSCLWVSHNVGNVLIDSENDEENLHDDPLMTGLCIKCCPVEYLLNRTQPNGCYFCVANKMTCISYEYMMKNITSLHDDFNEDNDLRTDNINSYPDVDSDPTNWSPWQWITAKASRLVLVALCLGLGLSSLIFVAFHFYMLRKCCSCPKQSHSAIIFAEDNTSNNGKSSLISKLTNNLLGCLFCLRKSPKSRDINHHPVAFQDIVHDEEARRPLKQNLSFTNNMNSTNHYMEKRPFSYHEKQFNSDRLLSKLTACDHSSSQPLPNVKQKLGATQASSQKSTISPEITPTSGSSFSNNSTNIEHPKSTDVFIDRRSRNTNNNRKSHARGNSTSNHNSNGSSQASPNFKKNHFHESLSGISKEIPKTLISPLSVQESSRKKTKRKPSVSLEAKKL